MQERATSSNPRVAEHAQPRNGRWSPQARRLVIVGVLLALAFGGLYAFNWYRQRSIAAFFASNQPPPIAVAIVGAVLSEVPRYFTGIGTLAAVREVVVTPEVAGQVARIFVESGRQVQAGEPLVQLQDAIEQADLNALRAQVRLAEVTLSRTTRLRANDVAAQATLDQNRAQLDQLNANVEKVKALIAQKLVRAPFAGELGLRQIDVGQFLPVGAKIVTLTDVSKLYVNFSLPEQSRAELKIGQAVEVANDAFPRRTFQATISAIEPQVDASTRAIKVQAEMDNPDRLLLPGMFADVKVVLPPQPRVVTLPETAVVYTLYGDSVFVVREEPGADGKALLKAMRVPVKTGIRFSGQVAILDGLDAGARVVSTGQNKLTDGAVVVPAESNRARPDKPPPRAQ